EQAFREAEHAIGDGISMMVVVEEPGVEPLFAQGCLDVLEVHAQEVYLITAEVEPSCGRLSPQAKSRAQRGISRGNTHHGGTETRRKLAVVPKTPCPRSCHPERPRAPARFDRGPQH